MFPHEGSTRHHGPHIHRAAELEHGEDSVEEHQPGNGAPSRPAPSRLQIPTSRPESSRNTRFDSAETSSGNFRPWLLLAPPCRMCAVDNALHEPGVLGREVSGQRSSRSPMPSATQSKWLARHRDLGMSNQPTGTIGQHPCPSRLANRSDDTKSRVEDFTDANAIQ
jgi:hypothetical protein